MSQFTSNTFFYFFSTSAQCLAGITALAFVAIQMRLSFLDVKVTAAKRVVISMWFGAINTEQIEHEMAASSASEILTSAKTRKITAQQYPKICGGLESAIEKMQDTRLRSRRLITFLVVATGIPLLQIPFGEWFCEISKGYQIIVLGLNSLGILVVGYFLIQTLGEVLDVRLKRKIDGET